MAVCANEARVEVALKQFIEHSLSRTELEYHPWVTLVLAWLERFPAQPTKVGAEHCHPSSRSCVRIFIFSRKWGFKLISVRCHHRAANQISSAQALAQARHCHANLKITEGVDKACYSIHTSGEFLFLLSGARLKKEEDLLYPYAIYHQTSRYPVKFPQFRIPGRWTGSSRFCEFPVFSNLKHVYDVSKWSFFELRLNLTKKKIMYELWNFSNYLTPW